MDWVQLCERWPYGERLFVVLMGTIVHAVSLWVPCLFFYAVESTGTWNQHKIKRTLQGRASDKKLLDQRAFNEQVIGTFVFVPVLLCFAHPLLLMVNVPISSPIPTLTTTCLHIAAMIIGCDTMFYWVHRSLHHPMLYKHIHKQHHEYKATNIWASEYFGAVDLICNVLGGTRAYDPMSFLYAVDFHCNAGMADSTEPRGL
eukprot:m.112429 g.112429  ORF g.112429 m.112429 type:complete len:201 (-) comp28193_c0_seq5:216-818(-)